MGYRKCPSCSGTGNVGLCRPCQGRGYFEFDSADVRDATKKSSNKIVQDINEVLHHIEETIRDKRLIDNPRRYLYANKAAQSITKEIKDLIVLNQDVDLLKECLLKAHKFNQELRLLINKPESSKDLENAKAKPTKKDPRQQPLF